VDKITEVKTDEGHWPIDDVWIKASVMKD
jgi:hypothetical protein